MSVSRAERVVYGAEVQDLYVHMHASVESFIADIRNADFLRSYGEKQQRPISLVPLAWRNQNLAELPLTLHEIQSSAIDMFRQNRLQQDEYHKVVDLYGSAEAAESSVVRAWKLPTYHNDVYVFEQAWLPTGDHTDTGLGMVVTNFIPDFAYFYKKQLDGETYRPDRGPSLTRRLGHAALSWAVQFSNALGYQKIR